MTPALFFAPFLPARLTVVRQRSTLKHFSLSRYRDTQIHSRPPRGISMVKWWPQEGWMGV